MPPCEAGVSNSLQEFAFERQHILTRMRADQHKCLPHLSCINQTLLFFEYFYSFGFMAINSKTLEILKAFHTKQKLFFYK